MSRYGTTATPDRPEFEVRVAGTAVQPLVQRDVVEIDVAEEVGRHGRLSLLVQNWDPDTRTVRHSDSGPFAPGASVEVLIGYHSQLTSVFAGAIASVTTHFPSDRRSDWDLLTGRAEQLGWVTYVRGESLVFRPPAAKANPLALEYGLNITEVHLTQDLTHAVDSVVAAGWDVDALEAIESEAGPSQVGIDIGDRQDHGAALGDAGWPLRAERAAQPALAAADHADAVATGRQRTTALGHYHGYGSIVGNPALRCDGWLTVAGVGDRMSGPHYVTAARHRLSAAGYRTEFQVGRPPLLAPPTPATARPDRLTVAVVESLEDPAGMNRVRVRLPWRGETGDGVWARLVTLDAGDGYGTVFVPDVGQEVLVGTLDGDASTPVVLGSMFNGAQAAPVTVSDDANPVRAIVTPEGHRITLEDGDASAVTIETPAGNQLKLAEADSAVTLTHGDSGNTITLSADGIELNAAQGDIVLKAASGKVTFDGTGIEGTSSGPSKLESSATFDLKASATLGLKGALVNIN